MSDPRPASRPGDRRDKLIQEERHDTYRLPRKLSEPTACPRCGAVYRRGTWRWEEAPADAQPHKCPACLRVEDDYPAGFVTISGAFLDAHRDEILNLARNESSLHEGERPLARIMKVLDREGDLLITTTDAHLARRIGDALHHAYAGELDYTYEKGESQLRVSWTRDD